MLEAFLACCYLFGLTNSCQMFALSDAPHCIPMWSIVGPNFSVSFSKRKKINQRCMLTDT